MLVKKLRLQQGWSQEQLAQLAGLHVRTIQRIERGQKAGLESMKSLAAVFEVEYQALITESDMSQSKRENPHLTDANPAPQGDNTQQSNRHTATANTVAQLTQEELEAMEYVKGVKEFYTHLASFVLVNIGLIALNLILTPQYLWFIFAAGGWGIGLLVHGLTTFEVFNFWGPVWERKQIEKRLGREL